VCALRQVYGGRSSVVSERCARIRAMAELYLRRFGDAGVVVARAPGRVNLMGRHVDHQGGHCNMVAIEGDLFAMAGMREDTRLQMVNLDSARFPETAADLGELVPGYGGGAWRTYVDTPAMAALAARSAGQWQQYVKAPLARLMALDPRRHWLGMDVVVAGDVPVAAGLSSSSALVVAVAEAAVSLAGARMEPEGFAEMCGEAEWYVGARGGSGDQAAMKFAREGCVVQLGFHPLRPERVATWPEGHALVVCHSGSEARKSGAARNTFNQRVACYHVARELVRQEDPTLAERVSHLRDLTPHRLGATDGQVARILRRVPVSLTRDEIVAALGPDTAGPILASHDWPTDPYALRSVALFGVAECERSRRCAGLLDAGNVAEVGRLMNVSHAGDRVTGCGPAGKPYDDTHMDDLVLRCDAGASLADEPGAYACSTPDIDALVDLALEAPGVLGAQLSGAGLGGCMMVLTRSEQVPVLREALERGYYRPRELATSIHVCSPVGGSGVLGL
jgi:N-acetylgalactosamine kinase